MDSKRNAASKKPGDLAKAYNTKWLRRIKVVDRYYMTYNDYGHISKDEEEAALTFQWGPKSVITFPSGGQKLPGPGIYQLTKLA